MRLNEQIFLQDGGLYQKSNAPRGPEPARGVLRMLRGILGYQPPNLNTCGIAKSALRRIAHDQMRHV